MDGQDFYYRIMLQQCAEVGNRVTPCRQCPVRSLGRQQMDWKSIRVRTEQGGFPFHRYNGNIERLALLDLRERRSDFGEAIPRCVFLRTCVHGRFFLTLLDRFCHSHGKANVPAQNPFFLRLARLSASR